ncbi:hypothetical protein FB45DRAFT_553717 [Roridomyces roridus]|uniref:Uncharacterized protein n=1 Tax=Roridomyces roridus TaxID=1738132 RepID=A0AAD7BUQ8_9AGAR|nr:hypothetical protein FB45DRAFT_553717 [Roridomyces roridus]
MPVNTVAYEIIFEFTNDTPDQLRLTGPSGSSVFVESGQDVVLVLTAGLTYQYVLKQVSMQPRKAQLSVRAWDDLKCRATSVFAGISTCGSAWPGSGITVTRRS